MKKYLFFIIFSIIFFSCKDSLDRNYSKDSYGNDLMEIAKTQDLTDAEMRLLNNYIKLAKLENININNKTYCELLKSAKKFNSLNEALETKMESEAQKKRINLGKIISAEISKKEFIENELGDYLQYTININNSSKRIIKYISGVISISEPNNTLLKTIHITENEEIKPQETIKSNYTSKFYRCLEEDSKLQYVALNTLKIIWTPEKIIYADGSTLE